MFYGMGNDVNKLRLAYIIILYIGQNANGYDRG